MVGGRDSTARAITPAMNEKIRARERSPVDAHPCSPGGTFALASAGLSGVPKEGKSKKARGSLEERIKGPGPSEDGGTTLNQSIPPDDDDVNITLLAQGDDTRRGSFNPRHARDHAVQNGEPIDVPARRSSSPDASARRTSRQVMR